jgi:hypothetical protein
MKIRKTRLRECAREVLEDRGFRVVLKGGPGIMPGGRLRAFKDGEKREVAVRTSLDREVGLTRHPDGSWMTLPNVDEVLVAAPALDDPESAEVLSFDPEVLIRLFDQELAGREKHDPALSYKAPIFLALDPPARTGSGRMGSGLKERAQWHTTIPLASVARRRQERGESFVERVKREFAELNGVDVSKVVVEFRIIA